jgi:hypothetical protein
MNEGLRLTGEIIKGVYLSLATQIPRDGTKRDPGFYLLVKRALASKLLQGALQNKIISTAIRQTVPTERIPGRREGIHSTNSKLIERARDKYNIIFTARQC